MKLSILKQQPKALLYLGLRQTFLAVVMLASTPTLGATKVEKETAPLVSALDKKERALNDIENRIANEFAIPASLKKRTAFWFDVYSKYGSNDHVIHHVLYPWVVYKVINTSDVLNGPGHRWTKYHKSERLVRNEHRRISTILKKLAKMKSYSKLSADEKAVFAALSEVPGSRRRVIREALGNTRVQLGQRDFFKSGLVSSAVYLPIIEKEFAARGLPLELARLPFVESSFNVKAESKVGASGIWQIMPVTGRHYLTVNDDIDERNSPLKASIAAADILRKNMNSLKAWPLALTAYNHGPAGVRQALRIAKVDNLPALIEKYHGGNFRFASANFYTSFLAALHLERYHEQIFMDEDFSAPSLNYKVLALEQPMRVKTLLAQLKMSADDLLTYNLDLKNAIKSNSRLPRGYKLIVPAPTHEWLKKDLATGRKSFKEAILTYKFSARG